VLLLAFLLTLAQVSVASHDAHHFSHAHTNLCDQLQHGGHFPALATTPVLATLPPAATSTACVASDDGYSQSTYPAFHSRAPPR